MKNFRNEYNDAWKYERRQISREEAKRRMDELLAYEYCGA